MSKLKKLIAEIHHRSLWQVLLIYVGAGTLNKRVATSGFVVLLAMTAHPSFAQSVGIGGRIGPTFTTFGGDVDAGSKTGFMVGGFFIYNFSEMVGVHPELSFVRKGESSTAQGSFIDAMEGTLVAWTLDRTVDLDYLELQVPITLMIPAHKTGIRARMYVGPTVALELKCTADLRLEVEEFSQAGTGLGVDTLTASGGCEDEALFPGPLFTLTKSLDFGLVFGAGINIGIGNGAITGDIRYDLGLVNINEGSGGSIKNRALGILVGYAHHISE